MSILDRVSAESSVPVAILTLVARTSDHRYKLYTIPKVSGGRRQILHPAREVKFLQRWIVSQILRHAPVHPAATAYQPGASVRNNVIRHAGGKYFLKLDFMDFFPSITALDVQLLLKAISPILPIPLTDEDTNIVAKLVTRHGQLPIGAPSSPVISNAVMYDFDNAMDDLAQKFSCVYTRYADDIVFSTQLPRVLSQVLVDLRQHISKNAKPFLRINEAKVAFTSKKRRVRITGLVIDCDKQISIGRDKKRKIKALVNEFRLARLNEQEISHLKGYLAYINSVEPKFLSALEVKYGREVIEVIRITR